MEHCRSYYAATANNHTRYPELQGQQHADVCVVGAGFTGINTALNLTERGYSVIVIEANRVGWGASGRNGGQMIGGISGAARLLKHYGPAYADMIWDLGWQGNEIIKRNVQKYAIDCDLKPGYMDVAIKPRHMHEFERYYAELQRRDFPYEFRLVYADEVRGILDTDAYIGGLINMGSGHLHPLNLCLGEAAAAARLGVRIYEQSAVTNITHGDKVLVWTQQGQVRADYLVLAGNAYHQLEGRHLSGIVFPAGSFIIATEQLNKDLANRINRLDLAVCDPNYVLDYFRLSADKRLLFGGRCNYSGREPESIQKTMLPRMLRIFPQLAGVRIDYEWGGRIGIVINRIPHLGCIGRNVFYAQGYSGHGVNVTHLTAGILAEVISGTSERFDVLSRIKHIRVPGGQWFGNQLVALGMIYFRLRDLL